MTVEKIIRMLENPATIGDALLEAAKLPFRGEDKVRFKQKQHQYIDGLSDHQLIQWVSQIKGLLSIYEECRVGATDGEGYRSYTFDRKNRWHYLDKTNLRFEINRMCREKNTENKVKVVFIQDDYSGCSRTIPQIIESFIKKDNKNIYGENEINTISKIKGSIARPFCCPTDYTPEIEWEYNMREFFDLSSSFEEIPAEFNNNDRYKQLHIIVHGIKDYDKDCRHHFYRYYDLWVKKLNPEKLILLCVHIEKVSLYDDEELLPNYPYYYYQTHEKVTKIHFQDFYTEFKKYYQEDEELCKCDEPKTFKCAINKLKFKEKK